jgi:hypothetical protein
MAHDLRPRCNLGDRFAKMAREATNTCFIKIFDLMNTLRRGGGQKGDETAFMCCDTLRWSTPKRLVGIFVIAMWWDERAA